MSGPHAIWSDGVTVGGEGLNIYAYDMATKARVPGKDFETLRSPGRSIWSDGVTMWVSGSDYDSTKIYAYHMP